MLVAGLDEPRRRPRAWSSTINLRTAPAQIADDLARQYPGRIAVMHRTGKRGLGRSYIDGISTAIQEPVDVICQMDADLSHDPKHLPEPDRGRGGRRCGHRIALHTRRRDRQLAAPPRRLLSRFANIYIRGITRLARATARAAIAAGAAIASGLAAARSVHSPDGYSFLVEMLFVAARRGARIAEVPITFVERREGESKFSRAVLVESAITPWRLVGDRSSLEAPPKPADLTAFSAC